MSATFDSPKHLIRLALSIESIRNNCFYGRIYVKYNKSSLVQSNVEEIVTTKPPLEITKVYKDEIRFKPNLISVEKPMNTAELTELLKNQSIELELMHIDRDGSDKLIGVVTLMLESLKDVKFVKTDDSYIKVYDSFNPIICAENNEVQAELRVKIFLEDCGPYDQMIANRNEKNDILKNLTVKTDLEIRAITQTKKPVISEDSSDINFGILKR